MDKNEFRYIKKGDLIIVKPVEKKPWYVDFYEFVRSEIDSMLELVRDR